MNDSLYVQFGCGDTAPAGWVNFDASPRLLVEKTPVVGSFVQMTIGKIFPTNVRFGNIVKGLPVGSNSARGVFASHVLEHLPRGDVPAALANVYRILYPGGTFRLIVPDLEWRAKRYLSAVGTNEPNSADWFLDSCALGAHSRDHGLGHLRSMVGNSKHLWMYDFPTMKELLVNAGFENIRRCQFGDSADGMFAQVEGMDRFFDGEHPELAIEATKPLQA
jgi:hypothetical protein